jgi:hypothetical protein
MVSYHGLTPGIKNTKAHSYNISGVFKETKIPKCYYKFYSVPKISSVQRLIVLTFEWWHVSTQGFHEPSHALHVGDTLVLQHPFSLFVPTGKLRTRESWEAESVHFQDGVPSSSKCWSNHQIHPYPPWAGGVTGNRDGWVTHRTLFSSNCVRGLWGDIIPLHRRALPNMTRTKWQREQSLAVGASRQWVGQHKKTDLPRHESKPLLWIEEANARRPASLLEVSWRHRADPFGLENSLSGHRALGIPRRPLCCFCLTLLSPPLCLSAFNWQPHICHGFPQSSRPRASRCSSIGSGRSPRCPYFPYAHISAEMLNRHTRRSEETHAWLFWLWKGYRNSGQRTNGCVIV